MNYIKKLQAETAAHSEQVLDARECLNILMAYLQSQKFQDDKTIQVQDVLNRLEAIRVCLTDAYYEIKVEKYKELV